MKAYKSGNTYKVFKETQRTYYKRLTFNASSSFQSFIVPSNITSIIVDCVASKGTVAGSVAAGKGGRVQCTLSVTPNQTLYIMVGGVPSSANIASYNASDIRTNNAGVTNTTSLNSRIIVAGGGGSAGTEGSSTGNGGGLTGGYVDGNNGKNGRGGTQTAGGAGGAGGLGGSAGSAGTFGLGGNGSYQNSGSGGAGWYGGGGAGHYSYYGAAGGNGGGGSSYTNNQCTDVIHTQGYHDGAGYINIDYISTSSDYDYYTESDTYKAFNV